MELEYSLLVLSCFFFLFMLFKEINTSRNKNAKLPPGPYKLPIIGNIHQLARGSLPHQTLTDLAKKYGPMMHLQLGEISTIIVSSPEIAKEFLHTHDAIFATRPFSLSAQIVSYNYKDIGFAPYGNHWRQLRKICMVELLSPSRVRSFQSIRAVETMNLMKVLSSSAGLPINLGEKIFSVTYGIIARAAFGEVCKEKEEYINCVNETFKQITGFSVVDLYPSIKVLEVITGMRRKLEKVHQDTDKIIVGILNEHKERMKKMKNREGNAVEDLVDVLLKHQQQDDLEFPVTDDTIKAVIWDIFSGGGESSSTTMIWAMSEMLKNPRVMKVAQSEVRQVYGAKAIVDESKLHELKFLRAVIKETLRLHPPGPLLMPRESMEECEINGYKIPVRTKVLVNAWAIGRDPKCWPEPEKFNPKRFVDSSIDYKGTYFEYIPFSAGRRICPGITFAQPAVELPLAQMLYYFDWELAHGLKPEDLDMDEAYGLTVGRKEPLIVVPTPH